MDESKTRTQNQPGNRGSGGLKVITITAFIGSALAFSVLILAGIAGWVIEIICYWQEARENREGAKKDEDHNRKAS